MSRNDARMSEKTREYITGFDDCKALVLGGSFESINEGYLLKDRSQYYIDGWNKAKDQYLEKGKKAK
jgi:hypothetical protein